MEAALIRQTFLDFFRKKGHEIVSSSPMVMKDDPTLMFTNAGMNQFKDFFLGNLNAKHLRVADTQKCLRVSGKHNDLEEVGVDTYHHTFFEMLGNWSFGDYFKPEAIEWAYELLVQEYGINKDDLYVTYFGGDEKDGLAADEETKELWSKFFDGDRILSYGKKDNFWEMGETGPCGPCTEIHIDLRDEAEKKEVKAQDLINESHPQVIELWNLVFIQFNRNKDQSLHELPKKHVDTGMGFERLAMVLQGKRSNYDTDIFMPMIHSLEKLSGKKYGFSETKQDIAFRVIVDHIRAVSISIAEGQMPSNTGAGYVIRRILRRAIRYAYSYLDAREAEIYKLVPMLDERLGSVFPELRSQATLIQKVVKEEEETFLNTLSKGIERFEKYIEGNKGIEKVDGAFAFELYDTYGFPLDLTELMAADAGINGGVDQIAFNKELSKQKERSRAATKMDASDWVVLRQDDVEEFIGYDHTDADVYITKYRSVKTKNKELFHLVFNITPFYAESGGQVGDTGYIENEGVKTSITDTKKENNLIIHFADKLPADPTSKFHAVVNEKKRVSTRKNHSATHLLHHALREILGEHIEQKGSLVNPDYLRFDFSHFEKVSEEDLRKIEARVNEMVRANYGLEENRSVPIDEAKEMGAMALFGEKYGDLVRVIKFGDSVELCGGIHVPNTAEIGHFKILSEGSISAGIRRIEAITGAKADAYLNEQLALLDEVRAMLKNPADVKSALKSTLDEAQKLRKEVERHQGQAASQKVKDIEAKLEKTSNGLDFVSEEIDLDPSSIKNMVFNLFNKNSHGIFLLWTRSSGKITLTIGVGSDAVKKGIDARELVKLVSADIKGGGGGTPNFVSAGGKNPDGMKSAEKKIIEAVQSV